MRTYQEILREVANACNSVFLSGYKDIRPNVVEAATKIYIAELQVDYCKKSSKTIDD